MTEPIRVFVNERPVSVPAGADVRAALAALDPELAARLESGAGLLLTDGRGVAIAPDAPLRAGAIVRAQLSARRADAPHAEEDDADAHA